MTDAQIDQALRILGKLVDNFDKPAEKRKYTKQLATLNKSIKKGKK